MKVKLSDRYDVVIAGLALVDIIGRPVDFMRIRKPGGLHYLDSITLTTGGNVCNCGIDLAKLGFRVGVITRVGSDGLGSFIQKELARHGVDMGGVATDERKQTSATIVGVGLDGERTFLHTRGCLQDFRVSDVVCQMSLVKKARIFAFGYLGLLPESDKDLGWLCRTLKEQTDVQILIDTGGTPNREPKVLRSFLPHVDYFLPSFEEAVAITGRKTPEDIVSHLYKWGACGVVGVKLGSKGCYIALHDRRVYVPAVPVKDVVDATGAGDAFVAGFLAATIRGFDPFAAAKIANVVAADCVTAVGASTAIRRFDRYVSVGTTLKRSH